MAGPSAEKLATMGLLEKKNSIVIERVLLRNTTRRTELFTEFIEHNKDVESAAGVEWGKENTPTSNGIRCNASIVLASVGARIPENGQRAAKDIEPKLQYPKEALAEWGNEFLTSSHIKYKGGDRILISEPSKMKIDRFFDYLPKKVHDTRHAISTKFAADNVTNNPGLTAGHITIKWILLRCNIAMDHRGDVEEHTLHTHGVNINEIEREAPIQVNDTLMSHRTDHQVKVREVSKTSKLQRTDRQTDILTSICSTRRVKGHKLSLRKEMQFCQFIIFM